MEVSRSNLMERVHTEPVKRVRYRKEDDLWLLPMIKKITTDRPTYGYRRVTALLNLDLKNAKKLCVNHKRVYRIMRQNSLLLRWYTRKPSRTHDGQVITLRSNTRWCSDSFVIQCWNGDRVHVVFALDTCDREAIRYLASTLGVNGSMVLDLLMIESAEYRFGKLNRLPHAIQWLSDNGPCYTAHETVKFGRTLGFEICTTPSYSPESNGLAEAFVNRFKRDNVWFGKLTKISDGAIAWVVWRLQWKGTA